MLDHDDMTALREAVQDHRTAAIELEERRLFTEEERVGKEIHYFDTQHKLDVLCERLGVSYGEDIANLDDLLDQQMGGISD